MNDFLKGLIAKFEITTHSKLECTETLRFTDKALGDDKKHDLKFYCFDGFAFCPNFKGKLVYAQYPTKKFISLAKNMERTIREYRKLEENAPITSLDILICYNSIHLINLPQS